MSILKQSAVFLITLSQLCLAFHSVNESVFCVGKNGAFAIETSINGFCADSKKWRSIYSNCLVSTLINQIPSTIGCRDISLSKTEISPETEKNLNGNKYFQLLKQPRHAPSLNPLRPLIAVLDKNSFYSPASGPNYRRTTVFLI